ncbi:MAG TPA: acyl-CoA dehydrogenase family protein, partial [Rhizomicrobium sp.]|nr:acyl-CoA dehydrogenase family protein [Rhizomicrobium sp.]
MNALAPEKNATYDWADPLLLDAELTTEERMVRESARAYCTDHLAPRVRDGFRNETFDRKIMTEMGEIGFLGLTLPEQYGGANMNYVSYGLVAREVERIDSGYRSAMSVQNSLVMHPIFAYGSEEQRKKYLPKLA